MINQAFNDAFGCQPQDSCETQQSARLYTDAEDYRQKTGKRFRMTKQELNQYGLNPEGRQQAFLARQTAGKL